MLHWAEIAANVRSQSHTGKPNGDKLMETREFSEKSDEILNCPQYLCYHVAYDTDAF